MEGNTHLYIKKCVGIYLFIFFNLNDDSWCCWDAKPAYKNLYPKRQPGGGHEGFLGFVLI